MHSSGKDVFDQLDALLSSQLGVHLRAIPHAAESVKRALARNARDFEQWVQSTGVSSNNALRNYFNVRIREMERILSGMREWGDFADRAAFGESVAYLGELLPKAKKNGLFLREASAARLLAANPPQELLGGGLLRDSSSLEYLSLTRHTESAQWQDAYLASLAECTEEDFEERPVRTVVVDNAYMAKILERTQHITKPWRMSHAKETGLVTCFTADPACPLATPVLMLAALLAHYSNETARAGISLHHLPERVKTPGAYVAAMIKSTRRKLSFFNPNLHSEALYWESAITDLNYMFPTLQFGQYVPILARGDFFQGELSPGSLNLIDHLWNVNFTDENLYLKSATSFLYHFREALWSELLGSLRKFRPDEMSYAVLNTLDIDDVAFTKIMLEKTTAKRSLATEALRLITGAKHYLVSKSPRT